MASVMIDAVCAVADGDHFARSADHGVGIQMPLNPSKGFAADGLFQARAGAPVEIDDPASPVIVLLPSEIEQALDDDGRNPALLQTDPGMVRKI
jgi:hypothetical protein